MIPESKVDQLRHRLNAIRALHGTEHENATYGAASEWAAGFRAALIEQDAADTLVDAGLVADQLDLLYDSHLTNSVQVALGRIGTSLPDGALHYFRSHELMGWTNLIEGTVFEQAVADAANQGDFLLPNGADHVELASRTQDGWDLTLLKGTTPVGYAQVKFAPDDHSIVMHLQNNPDVPIVIANHEAAIDAVNHNFDVIDAGIGYQGIHSEVAGSVARQLDFAHFVHEWVPETAALFILGMALYRRWWKGERAEDVKAWSAHRLGTAGAVNATATVASVVTGSEIVRLPVSLATRLLLARGPVSSESARHSAWLGVQVGRLRNDDGLNERDSSWHAT